MREFFLLILAILFLPIIIFAIPIASFFHKPLRHYFKTVAIGLDQFGGSVLYNQENLTVSSYTHFLCLIGNKSACLFEKFINFFFGKDHCRKAYEWEIANDIDVLKEVKNGAG